MSAMMTAGGGSPAAGTDEAACDDQSGRLVSYLELAAISSAPFWARRQTSAVLNAWQLPDEADETAQLIVSELVTNSVKAASPGPALLSSIGLDRICRIALTLRLLRGRVVIEVFDTHPDPPVPCDVGPDDDHMPRAETMTAFLDEVDGRYGGVLRWLADHGFAADDLASLHAKLLAA